MTLLAMPADAPEPDMVEVLYAIDPHAWERAKRVKMAMELLRSGMPTSEIQRVIRVRFGISRMGAWRVVDIAVDMAG